MRYLGGVAFDCYYETFAPDGKINVEGLKYDNVKEALLKNFGRQKNPQDAYLAAMSTLLDPSDSDTSLSRINALLN